MDINIIITTPEHPLRPNHLFDVVLEVYEDYGGDPVREVRFGTVMEHYGDYTLYDRGLNDTTLIPIPKDEALPGWVLSEYLNGEFLKYHRESLERWIQTHD